MFNFSNFENHNKSNLTIFIMLLLVSAILNMKISNIGNKFLERCEDKLTCDSCAHMDYCGWCYTDGQCKSGNEIGPSQLGGCNFSDWETSSCRMRDCDNYENVLSCVTQKDCLWCGTSVMNIKLGKCAKKKERFNLHCEKQITLEQYMKTTKQIKNEVNNIKINDVLELASKLNNTNNHNSIDIADSKQIKDPQFLKYSKFINQLNVWTQQNKKTNYTLYDPINNPTGSFPDQIKSIINTTNKKIDYNLNLGKDFDVNSFKSLSIASKKEIITICKKIATDLLKPMFFYKENSFHNYIVTINTVNYKGGKNYLILESIAGDEWDGYLQTMNLNTGSVLEIQKLDMSKSTNLTEILIRQNKLSLMYPFKFHNEGFQYLKLLNETWGKLPGSNITLNAYLNTTVFISQKIRLFGNGTNFKSLFFHNQMDLKSLSYIQTNKTFNRIDLTNYAIRQITPGTHNLYTAYNSDFQIDNENENNMILTNTLELPYVAKDGVGNTFGQFDMTKYLDNKTQIFFNIKELTHTFKVNTQPYSALKIDRFNYIVLYNIFVSKETISSNLFFKLKVSQLSTKLSYKETITSNSVYFPSFFSLQNINGLTMLNLPDGVFEVTLGAKTIFEESNDEKLVVPPIKDEYSNTEKSEKKEDAVKSGKDKKKDDNDDDDDRKNYITDEINFLDILDEGVKVKITSDDINDKDTFKKYYKIQKQINLQKRIESLNFETRNLKSKNSNKSNSNKDQLEKTKKNSIKQKEEEKTVKVEKIVKATEYSGDNDGSIFSLENHLIKCGDNSAINSFHYERDSPHNRFRYTYKCVKSDNISNKCLSLETLPNETDINERASDDYLERHRITCDKGDVLRSLVLARNQNRIYYKYECCAATIKNCFENSVAMSDKGDKSTFSLEKQEVDAKEYNVFSSVHLSTPISGYSYQFTACPAADAPKPKVIDLNPISGELKGTQNYDEKFKDQSESGEISILRLPITSVIYTMTFKSLFYFKGNNELNEIPNMKKQFKLESEKNIMIQTNIILTLPTLVNFEFRLYIDGKDDSDSFMVSKNEHIISLTNMTIDKLPAGEHRIELLYMASANGYANMNENDWDVVSINILLLETS